MKLHRSDCIVVRSRSFSDWREIIEAALERRERLKRVLEERRDWFRIQQQSDLGLE